MSFNSNVCNILFHAIVTIVLKKKKIMIIPSLFLLLIASLQKTKTLLLRLGDILVKPGRKTESKSVVGSTRSCSCASHGRSTNCAIYYTDVS